MKKKNSCLLALPDKTESHPQAKMINPVPDHNQVIRKPTQVCEAFAQVRQRQTHLWQEQTQVMEEFMQVCGEFMHLRQDFAHLWEKLMQMREVFAQVWERLAHLCGKQIQVRQDFTHLLPGNFALHGFDIDVNYSQIPMRIRIK